MQIQVDVKICYRGPSLYIFHLRSNVKAQIHHGAQFTELTCTICFPGAYILELCVPSEEGREL